MLKRGLFLLLAVCAVCSAGAARKSSRKGNDSERIPVVLGEQERQRFDYLFQQAENLKHQEKFAEAFEIYRQCTLVDSLNPQPWFELSSFYRSMNMVDPALSTMEKARRLQPTNEWYAFGLANLYLALNREKDAIVLYEDLVRMRPDDENLLFQLGGLYAKTKNYKAAIAMYAVVERYIGKNESVSFEKFKAYKEMGKEKKAIREVETLRDEFPFDVDYVLLLGDAWLELSRPDKALLTYMDASKMDPTNPTVFLSLADYYNTIGDSAAASVQLQKALTNPDTEIDIKLNILSPILLTSLKNRDSTKIQSYFDLLLDQHPNEYQIRELYVQWLLETGKKQVAKDELRTVLDLNPNQLKAWRNYLEINLEYDNQGVIRTICSEALTYFPKEAIFWFYYGLSWTSEQDSNNPDAEKCRQAIQAFQRAIDVANTQDNGFVSRLHGLSGDMYLLLGDTVKAFDYYEKALVIFPNNFLVLNNYAYYLSLNGKDLSKAERMSRKTIEADPKNATYLDTFAWVFFKQGQYSLAKIYIERALSNEPDPGVDVLEHYGDILWFNQDQKSALEQWNKASKLANPNSRLLKKVETGKYTDEAINTIK